MGHVGGGTHLEALAARKSLTASAKSEPRKVTMRMMNLRARGGTGG